MITDRTEKSVVIKAFIILLIYNQMVFSQQNITSFMRAKVLFLVYTFQSLNSYDWTVTTALVGNLHSPQNKTVMAVGHFLVQFLCPASKIRIKWRVVRQI